MIPGEHAEAARVNRQAFGESELEREVRDAERRLRVHEPRLALVVLVVGRPCIVKGALDLLAFGRPPDAFLAELREEEDGIFTRRLPELGVKSAKQSLDAGLPGPEQVVSELI